MTDLNKERELCNQSFEKYWDDFCEAYGNGFDRSLAKLFFANAWGEAKAQAVPDTHVVVPRVPTENMLSAGCSSISYGMTNEKNSERIYKAMVKASESGAEG
jgi:hypothetical protein